MATKKKENAVPEIIDNVEALEAKMKAIEQGRAKYPNGEEMDADYRRMKYARYADDFLVGIIGSS